MSEPSLVQQQIHQRSCLFGKVPPVSQKLIECTAYLVGIRCLATTIYLTPHDDVIVLSDQC